MAAKKRVSEAPSPQLTHNPFAALGAAAGADRAATPAPAAPNPSVQTPPATLRFDHKLVIRRELKGRGGKTVTRITGLPRRELETLATTLKKKLGCGALVEREDLLLLGDLVDRAADFLAAQGATRIVKGN